MTSLSILHVDHDASDFELIRSALQEAGVQCTLDRVSTRSQFETAMRRNRYSVVLADFSTPGFENAEPWRFARQIAPSLPIIFVSRTREISDLKLPKGTKFHHLSKGQLEELGGVVVRAHHDAMLAAAKRLGKQETEFRKWMEETSATQVGR